MIQLFVNTIFLRSQHNFLNGIWNLARCFTKKAKHLSPDWPAQAPAGTTNIFGAQLQPASMLEQHLMDICEVAAGKQALVAVQRLGCSVQLWERGLSPLLEWEVCGYMVRAKGMYYTNPHSFSRVSMWSIVMMQKNEEKHLLQMLSTVWVGHHRAWERHSQLGPCSVTDEGLPIPVFSASLGGIV